MANRKFPLAWHEQNLVNRKASWEADLKKFYEFQTQLVKDKDVIAFSERQIAEAKKRGLTAFCRELFLKKERKGGLFF